VAATACRCQTRRLRGELLEEQGLLQDILATRRALLALRAEDHLRQNLVVVLEPRDLFGLTTDAF